MSRLSMLAALLLAFGLAGHASASAWAESKPSNPAAVPKITESQARSIAFRHGLVHVEEIALSDSRWEIAGRAQGGVEVTLDLNAYDGSVIGGAAALTSLAKTSQTRDLRPGSAPLPQKLAGTAFCSLSPRALSAYIPLAVRKGGYGDKRTSK